MIGIDYKGNRYYEMEGANVQDRRIGEQVLPKRWYFPPSETDEDWDQYIPPEWEAWLRYRRIDAPSEEEVNLNLAVAYAKQLNAAKMKEAEQRALKSSDQITLPPPADNVTRAIQAPEPQAEDMREEVPYNKRTGENPSRGFPSYDEYELSPDQGSVREVRRREAERYNPYID
jgi:NADH:ubiquinone oxidoreductase subunit